MVFIIEPLFWVAFGVPLILTLRRFWLKATLLFALAGVLTFFTLQGFLAWWSLSFLALLAVFLGIVQRKAVAGARAALVAAFAFMVAFAGMQHAVSRHAYDVIETDARLRDSASATLDVALTAFPVNPVCWSFVSVESDEQAGTYRLRRGQLSVLPSMLPVAQCPSGFLEPAKSADSVIALSREETGSLDRIRRLKAENCHFDAWLRFARMPSVGEGFAFDLRYATSPRGNFTTLDFDEIAAHACSPHVPQWGYPRADMLAPP